MLLGENLFTTFTTSHDVSNTLSNDGDFTLQAVPKLENNDLLLENLDFHLMNDASVEDQIDLSKDSSETLAPFIIDSSVFESVFNNNHDPLLEPVESVDDELKEMFDLMEADTVGATEEPAAIDLFPAVEPESRSKSNIVAPVSVRSASTSPSCKRSYSTADLADASDANSASGSKDKLGCTPYTRKQRSNPLPPVVAKGEDIASLKRARNTEAARRSRARKMERMSQLETKCEDLMKENETLKAQLESLKLLLQQKASI